MKTGIIPANQISMKKRIITKKFRAMHSTITVQLVNPSADAGKALVTAKDAFDRIELACTRFDRTSSLMCANFAGEKWHSVLPECYLALLEAVRGYRETEGLFDPRILQSLLEIGYDRTLSFSTGTVSLSATNKSAVSKSVSTKPWLYEHNSQSLSVRIGPRPVDLGGIGKGLAVRLSARALAGVAQSYSIEAGGDCQFGGDGPKGSGWLVGVEDPRGGNVPIAALQLKDVGCATSSLRIRRWLWEGRKVHHIIDPRTGMSAQGGLAAVTVVAQDAARAEIWTKALFVSGKEHIADLAQKRGLAVLWVSDDGQLGYSKSMIPLICWRRKDMEKIKSIA